MKYCNESDIVKSVSQYTVVYNILSYDSGVTALKMYGELLLNMGPYYHSS